MWAWTHAARWSGNGKLNALSKDSTWADQSGNPLSVLFFFFFLVFTFSELAVWNYLFRFSVLLKPFTPLFLPWASVNWAWVRIHRSLLSGWEERSQVYGGWRVVHLFRCGVRLTCVVHPRFGQFKAVHVSASCVHEWTVFLLFSFGIIHTCTRLSVKSHTQHVAAHLHKPRQGILL